MATCPFGRDAKPYVAELDALRLARLQDRVEHLMGDGRWRTLREITQLCGGSEAGVSARLREMRKAGWTVSRRRNPRLHASAGSFQYRASKEVVQ